ncbi:hypothetical protein RF679_02455 [Undibacterium cyanobacteriorum]|uniref:SMODS and SLOG-associating 2TM effector domain-containing protein n=1 Tax=Undibacterium cyanobacteriorum TaxID=3073561 RepID=A0ABY9RIV4_9BURK|nr:hypothetical protein [Undibacterium sp. 20NA77.5]WMW81157.1 hypothetical protein RF679_02455 [Undibacterium sp. 20NA77.5]
MVHFLLFSVHMSDQEKNLPSSTAPINARTAVKPLAKTATLHPLEAKKIEAIKHRYLQAKQMPENFSRSHLRAPIYRLPATMAFIPSVFVSVAALVNGNAWMLGAGFIALVGSGLWLRQTLKTQTKLLESLSWFEVDDLQKLDDLLERVTQQSDVQLQQMLSDMRQLLSRVIDLQLSLYQAGQSHRTDLEREFYLREFIGRYWPDTLHAYLQVSPEARDQATQLDGKTAHELLYSQLALLQEGLCLHQQALQEVTQQHAIEQLIQQQVFLESKKKQNGS